MQPTDGAGTGKGNRERGPGVGPHHSPDPGAGGAVGGSRWRQMRLWWSSPPQEGSSWEEAGGFRLLGQSGLRLFRTRRGICGRIESHTCIQFGPASWGSQEAQPGQSWSPCGYSPCPRGPLWSHSQGGMEGRDSLEGMHEASCYPLYRGTQGILGAGLGFE